MLILLWKWMDMTEMLYLVQWIASVVKTTEAKRDIRRHPSPTRRPGYAHSVYLGTPHPCPDSTRMPLPPTALETHDREINGWMEDKDRKTEKDEEKEKDKVVKETWKTIDKSLQCSVLIPFFFLPLFSRKLHVYPFSHSHTALIFNHIIIFMCSLCPFLCG